jgi:hypothetical protein
MLKVIEGSGWFVGKGRDGDLVGSNQRAAHAMVEVEVELELRCHPQIWSVALVQRAVLSVLIFGKLWLHIDTNPWRRIWRPANQAKPGRENSSSGHS